METFLGGQVVAGGKIKALIYWSNPNTGASNESGFTALPGGHRSLTFGNYSLIGSQANIWTSSTSGSRVVAQNLKADSQSLNLALFTKDVGASVRCLKDD